MPYTVEEYLQETKEEFLQSMTIEERLQGLSSEELLKRVPKEERLQGLSKEEIRALIKHLEEQEHSDS